MCGEWESSVPVVQSLQVLRGDVAAVVDATVVLHETLLGHFVFHPRVVRIRVQHDRRERQHVRGVWGSVHTWVLQTEPLRELFHQPVDFLRLAR